MGVQMGTFGSFTTARLAIYASQASLNVTGNNIANINTKGYTRQRMDLVSLYPTGEARYANNYNLSIGYGVLCDSVSQLRDPFLDIRYRNENASLGAYEAKLNGLKQLSHILDEVGKGDQGFGVIEDQLGDFIEQLQGLNNLTGIEEYDNLVRASASQLCSLFNAAATDLQEVYDNQVSYLEQNVAKANSLLGQIRDLNEQIRAHNIYGDNALELRDARNVAIDELSSLMKIDVTYSMEKIDQFTEVEKLTITLPGTKDPAISKADAQAAAAAENAKHIRKNADGSNMVDADGNPVYEDGYPKTIDEYGYNYSSNFDKPIKLIDGIYGTQFNIKKTYKENVNYQGQYVTADGKYTDDVNEAGTVNGALILNPAYGKPFLEVDADGNPKMDADGRFIGTDTPTSCRNPAYGKYFDADGEPTDDIEKADYVYDDKFLMDIDPLVDKRGKYMRDPKYGNQLTNSIDLKDNDLFGAIQSMRELLTEEGEFSSNYELGRDLDEIEDEDERYRAELVADPNANMKRGIPYYMKALDNLAQQFARELNKLNQPDQYASGLDANKKPIFAGELDLTQIYKTYEPEKGGVNDYGLLYATGTDPDNTADTKIYFLDQDGAPVVNAAGNKIGPEDVKYADLVQNEDGNYYDPEDDNDPPAFINPTLVQTHKDNLEALKAGGVSNPTFVDKNGSPVTYKDADGNKVPITYDDVKYAALDPLTLHEDFAGMTRSDLGLPADAKDAELRAAQFEAQDQAIRDAQEKLEVLRDEANLTDEWNFYNGGVLLSNSNNNNDPTGITAANISVSQDWDTGAVRVLKTLQPNEVTYDEHGNKTVHTHSTAGDNFTHMISSLKGQRDFFATDIDADSAAKRFYFRGSFQEMFTSISGTLGVDTNETTSLYNRYDLETLNLENDRQSISGVDLNEEATSMMQYQKSFSAACQLLTIIDSMLDKLINGTI